MGVQVDHTIVPARDRAADAAFFTEMSGLLPAAELGPVLVARLADQASIDVVQHDGADLTARRDAFLVAEHRCTAIHERILARGVAHRADPAIRRPGETNRHDGGRGVDFPSSSGHFLEAITRPSGAGAPV